MCLVTPAHLTIEMVPNIQHKKDADASYAVCNLFRMPTPAPDFAGAGRDTAKSLKQQENSLAPSQNNLATKIVAQNFISVAVFFYSWPDRTLQVMA